MKLNSFEFKFVYVHFNVEFSLSETYIFGKIDYIKLVNKLANSVNYIIVNSSNILEIV